MDKKDLNEIKAAIKYMDYKPLLLSKFFDVKRYRRMKNFIRHRLFFLILLMIIRLLNV